MSYEQQFIEHAQKEDDPKQLKRKLEIKPTMENFKMSFSDVQKLDSIQVCLFLYHVR